MKKSLVVLGAAAMVAAAAVPALAFENEFHGMYRLRGMLTNFQAAGLGAAGAAPLVTTTNSERDFTLFEQRARLQYIAKASDDLKLVTHFEIDSTWGDAAYQTGRGMGGGLAADTVNLETKNVFLDFKVPSTSVNMKVGIQPFSDAYKGVFMSDDVAGAVATGKFGPATATAAFFRTYDKGTAPGFAGTAASLGKQVVDIYVLDAKAALGKALTVGGSYYAGYNTSNKHKGQLTHTIGVNAAAKIAAIDLDAFLLYQTGDQLYAAAAKDLEAYAGQVAAKVTVGPVGIRAAGLYASGDDGRTAGSTSSSAFQNVFASGAPGAAAGSSTSSGVYYSSNMLMLLRSAWAMDSDQALVGSINNGNQGLVALFVGADAKITDKFNVSANIGHAMVDQKNETVLGSATEKCTDKTIGTEANLALNYKVYDNLTATLQGAYVVLGGYGKTRVARSAAQIATGTGVKDPYLAGLMLNYTF